MYLTAQKVQIVNIAWLQVPRRSRLFITLLVMMYQYHIGIILTISERELKAAWETSDHVDLIKKQKRVT